MYLLFTQKNLIKFQSTNRPIFIAYIIDCKTFKRQLAKVKVLFCFFQVYINYVNLVVNLLLPTAVLSVMNCLIYRALRQNQDQANQVG